MTIHEQVVNDWKLALKNKDEKKNTLSLIINEFKNRAIKDNAQASDARMVKDESALEVLQKMAKQRKESIESFLAANRQELADKESFELAIIEQYLPEQMSLDELKILVKDCIIQCGASSMKDIGKVMGLAIKASNKRADGKEIQKIAQEFLKDE